MTCYLLTLKFKIVENYTSLSVLLNVRDISEISDLNLLSKSASERDKN